MSAFSLEPEARQPLMGEELATPLTQPYWDGLHRGELVLQRCERCERWQHYPRALCRSCWGRQLSFAATDGRGELLAAARSYRTPKPALRERLPINLGLVRLTVGPVVLAQLHGDPTTGQSVTFDAAETVRTGLLSFGPYRE